MGATDGTKTGDPVPSNERSGPRILWQQVGRPVLAYCIASYAAAITIPIAFMPEVFLNDLRSQFFGIAFFFVIVAAIVAAVALIPTLIAAGLLHLTRVPRGIAEICAGALIGPCARLLPVFSQIQISDSIGSLTSELAPFAIAGAVGGLTYWLVMGCPGNSRIP